MAGYNDPETGYVEGGSGFFTHLSHLTDITNKFDKDATPTDGQVLTWDSGTSLYLPETPTGGSGTSLVINVKDAPYSAAGNGSTNDTAAIQAAIDAAAVLTVGGQSYSGVVYFPAGAYVCGVITMKSKVRLVAAGWAPGQGYRESPVRLLPHASIPDDGYMIIQSGNIRNVAILGITCFGEGSSSKTGWANLPDVTDGTFSGLFIDNHGIEALILGGLNNRVSYSFFQGLMNRAYIAAERGATTLTGTDHQFSHNEFTGPDNATISSASLFCVAASINVNSSQFDHNVFQIGDCGASIIGGSRNRFVGNRWDSNAAHGLIIRNGTYMAFGAGNHWSRNSFATTNTYDHINVPSTGGSLMTFTTPMFTNDSKTIRYWINDAKNSATFHNIYLNPRGEAAGTASTLLVSSVVNHHSLSGSATWDPGSLASGAAANTTVTVTGAAVGDTVVATHSSVESAATSWILTGYVSAADTVRAVLLNATGGAVDLASGTLRVRVFKQ